MQEHEDYRDRRSPRQRLAEELAAWLAGNGLAPADVQPEREESGRCYRIVLRSAEGVTPSGSVRVYGTSYLVVQYSYTPEQMLPDVPDGREEAPRLFASYLFGSYEECVTHLLLALVEGRPDMANQVPERRPRRKGHAR